MIRAAFINTAADSFLKGVTRTTEGSGRWCCCLGRGIPYSCYSTIAGWCSSRKPVVAYTATMKHMVAVATITLNPSPPPIIITHGSGLSLQQCSRFHVPLLSGESFF